MGTGKGLAASERVQRKPLVLTERIVLDAGRGALRIRNTELLRQHCRREHDPERLPVQEWSSVRAEATRWRPNVATDVGPSGSLSSKPLRNSGLQVATKHPGGDSA